MENMFKIEVLKKQNIVCFFLYVFLAFFANRFLLLGQTLMKWDIMDAHYPNAMFLANSLSNGIFPLWNPLFNYGVPQYAAIGMPVYYPTTFLFSLFGYSVWFVGVEYCLHVVFACFGMFLLSKFFMEYNGYKEAVYISFAAGLIYGFSTVFLSNAQHLMIIISATWMPYVFLYVRKYLANNKILYLIIAGIFEASCIVSDGTLWEASNAF